MIHLCVDLTHISTSLGQARNILLSYDRLKHLQNCPGVLADDATGDHATETIYDDADPDQIETLPEAQIHRNVDLELLRADKEGIFFFVVGSCLFHRAKSSVQGYVKIYLILPSTIYGIASGILVEKGIQNPHSIQVPALIQASLERGRAGMVGQGLNFWPDVDIDDGRIFSMTTILPPSLTCSSGRPLPHIIQFHQNKPCNRARS